MMVAPLLRAEMAFYGDPFRVLHVRFVVEGGRFQSFRVEAWLAILYPLAGERLVTVHTPVVGEHGVDVHSEPYHERPTGASVVDGNQEAERLDQMLRDVQYGLSIPQRLSYERELVVLQVAQAAVDQTRRPLRRPAGDVALVQEQHPQAPHRGVTGYAGAVYAGSDHD